MTVPSEGPSQVPRALKCPVRDSTSSRNLVVCIDGTSNQFGVQNTNIVELYSHIVKSDNQLTYYSSGLGTLAQVGRASLRHRLSNGLDMAFGRNLHKVIVASYRWLSDNYRDGDSVFLFGFSRGAYQVRALAGMIARVGLLLPGNNEQIPFAFELYSNTEGPCDSSFAQPASVISQPTAKESEKAAESTKLAETFRKTFCRSDVHIHFVGVWDTVSSVGLCRGKVLPCTTSSCNHICYFRHALALDEWRVKFLPEYVHGGQSSHVDDGRIKEVWFAGCHSDVGGGNRRNVKLQSGDIPLLWMRNQAVVAGLEMEPGDVIWKIDDLNKHITHSLNPVWWLLELLPLKHLLYHNSDRLTSMPHFGGPRWILPGQKVHVSALFKNNYKPYARCYKNPERWPEPMFWNDVANHQRLRDLSDLWEKDIFDEDSVQTLLGDPKRDQPSGPSLDALNRLAFMSSFGFRKDVISTEAKENLAALLSKKGPIRLCVAVTYCELELEWPSESHDELVKQITGEVSELLKGDDCHLVCRYMPSLCKHPDLRAGLISDENLKLLAKYCDPRRIDGDEEKTSIVAFHSAQALSMLMKLDTELPQKLINIQAVSDVTEALKLDSNPGLVSALSVVDGLAKNENARSTIELTLPTILRLVKRHDDFVALAAIRVLCSCLSNGELRSRMLGFGVLASLFDMLDRCSDEAKRATCDALAEFAKHADVRDALAQNRWLPKLCKRARDQAPGKRDGAILALVALEKTQLSMDVKEALDAERTIPVLVARLHRKLTALSAASNLARLIKIDNVARIVSEGESVPRIVSMLRHRGFDGLRGEDGLQILSELLECERLRTAVMSAGALQELSAMIESEQYEDAYAGLHYLRVIIGCDKSGNGLSSPDVKGLIPIVVKTLGDSRRKTRMIVVEILRCLSAKEDLHDSIVQSLLNLLKDRRGRAGAIFAASTMLAFLAKYKPVRDSNRVLTETEFWDLGKEYYKELKLENNVGGSGPRKGEVNDPVGRMIQLIQAHDKEAIKEEKQWPGYVPYEPKRGHASGVSAIAMLMCCPALLLCGFGQLMFQELRQEG